MTIKNIKTVYLCVNPNIWNLEAGHSNVIQGHFEGIINGKKVIWPKRICIECCNPKNVERLKSNIHDNKVLIIDRTKNNTETISIDGHVNRSGDSYLIGNTPYNELSQFPDVTHLYKELEQNQKRVVHTLGPERFEKPINDTTVIWSEAVGLVAPLFYYVGIDVFAAGVSNNKQIRALFYGE